MSTNPSGAPFDAAPPPPGWRQWVGFCLAFFCFWASLYIYMPTFPVYAEGLGASLTMVGLIIASYGFVQFALRIPIGYLSDRRGARLPFILIGLLANAVGAIGMASFPTPFMLIIWRGFHGVGAASFVTSAVYFAGFFPPDQTTRATGLLVFMTALSQVVISMTGGILAEQFGVPFTFWSAAVIAGVGFAAMLLAGERAAPVRRPMTIRRFRGVLGIRSLITSSGIGALSQFVTFGLNISFIPIFAHTLGATKTDLGTLTTISYVAYASAALLAAVGGRRFGERTFVIAGSLFTTVTILILPAIDTVSVLVLLLGVNSFARGMVFPVLMGISIREVPEHERASAMGVFQSVYAIGMFAGPAVAGIIADAIGITGLFLFIAAFPILGAAAVLAWMPARIRTPAACV